MMLNQHHKNSVAISVEPFIVMVVLVAYGKRGRQKTTGEEAW
jgi:hypothetical protein